MICPACGNEAKEGAKFCNACGAKMVPVEENPVVAETPVVEEAPVEEAPAEEIKE